MITTAQLAGLLQLTEQTVSQYAAHGKIPGAVKVGNKWRFPDDAIDRMASQPRDPWMQSASSRGRKRKSA